MQSDSFDSAACIVVGRSHVSVRGQTSYKMACHPTEASSIVLAIEWHSHLYASDSIQRDARVYHSSINTNLFLKTIAHFYS
jgi:hypothetical protein